jgi:hypothetical protein
MSFYACSKLEAPVTIDGTIGGETASEFQQKHRSSQRPRSASRWEDVANRMSSEDRRDSRHSPTTILIPLSELEAPPKPQVAGTEDTFRRSLPHRAAKKPSWFRRHFGGVRQRNEVLSVRVRHWEYDAYFAKDGMTGEYREGVVEPPGGRRRWLRERVAEQEEWEADRKSYEAADLR